MKSDSKLLSAPYTVWMTVFIVLPMLLVGYFAFTDKSGSFTMENILSVGQYSNVFLRSIWLGAVATAVSLGLGYPLAYIISKVNVRRQNIMVMLVMLPMWMNFLLRTMAWETLLEKNGIINTVLRFLHLPALNIINTPSAIILGMVYNFLPFMVLPIYNALTKIDNNVVNAARDLGAGSFQTFLRIIFPLSLPGVISGITMVFVPALTTFVISTLLGGSKILLIGNVIEQEFTQTGNWHLGSGLSIVLMIFILINMVLSAIFDKDGEGATL